MNIYWKECRILLSQQSESWHGKTKQRCFRVLWSIQQGVSGLGLSISSNNVPIIHDYESTRIVLWETKWFTSRVQLLWLGTVCLMFAWPFVVFWPESGLWSCCCCCCWWLNVFAFLLPSVWLFVCCQIEIWGPSRRQALARILLRHSFILVSMICVCSFVRLFVLSVLGPICVYFRHLNEWIKHRRKRKYLDSFLFPFSEKK